MARKPQPKPLFSMKEDFIDSLQHFCQQAIFLHQQVDSALTLGVLKHNPAVEKLLRERADALRDAMVDREA